MAGAFVILNTIPERWLFALWGGCVVLLGGWFTSFHQPFRAPDTDIVLALLPPNSQHRWRAVHILSSSCGCSQKVMANLLTRRPSDSIAEKVLIVDGDTPALPESAFLSARLTNAGYPVNHLTEQALPPQSGVHGVPLLVIASPENRIAYIGGYGEHYDGAAALLDQAQAGSTPKPLAIQGCAIGRHVASQTHFLRLRF